MPALNIRRQFLTGEVRARSRQPAAPARARAFAPGHLTGLFSPELSARDPRARGSVGAGIVLELGVHAEAAWTPAARSSVTIRSDVGGPLPITLEVARRLLGRRPGRLTVALRHELPVGQGFGMSAAGAVATALAVAPLVGAPDPVAWPVAHLADLLGGGGLGGVSAITGGGWERRLAPGLPPWGRVRHARFPYRLFLVRVGRRMPSPEVLRRPANLARFRSAAATGLRALARRPTPPSLLDASERFTDDVALAPPVVLDLIAELRRAGGWAGQAMFGRSVWAVARTPAARARLVQALDAGGWPTVEVAAAAAGAHRERPAAGQSLLNRARLGRLP